MYYWIEYCCLQVYKREELQMIADLCIKHDVLAFADEVYEWMIFPGSEMIKLGKYFVWYNNA